jgi:hypothetical protein
LQKSPKDVRHAAQKAELSSMQETKKTDPCATVRYKKRSYRTYEGRIVVAQ